ncbi:hypothetical protein VNI00_010422 [Paramarasmius palmivorus]|uniref:F-box domain-containing protein n=1 Tax=Paramarasmius palmivorus TaxID=297713 RepID=A0AAW0CIZ0_9AGAR
MAGKRKNPPGTGDSGGEKKKRVIMRKGALHYVKELPLEILFEILNHVEPIDLLRLSRTCKDLRNILMSRKMSTLWKTSRQSAELPEIIPSMSEPAFVNLLLMPYCHFCTTAVVHLISWSAHLRCCHKCLPKKFSPRSELVLTGIEMPEDIWNFAIKYDQTTRAPPEWRELEDDDKIYLKSSVEALFKQFTLLEDDADATEKWIAEMASIRAADTKRELECSAWVSVRSTERVTELQDTRKERYKAVSSRLKALGWTDELARKSCRTALANHKLVNKPQLLTDKIWKNISSTLVAFISELKTQRLARERHDLLSKRFALLPSLIRDCGTLLPRSLIMPPTSDVALLEPFRSAIENTPLVEGAKGTHFDNAVPILPRFIQDWNTTAHAKVLKALQDHKAGSSKTDLCLSTSLFTCTCSRTWSRQVYAYPSILTHRCYSNSTFKSNWSYHQHEYKICTDALAYTMKIGELYNIDPAKTTIEEMLSLNPLVECIGCRTRRGSRLFMRWSTAVSHESYHLDQLAVVSQEDKERVEIEETEADLQVRRVIQKREPWYLCKKCNFRDSLKQVKLHLREAHHIDNISDQDWEFSPLGELTKMGPYEVELHPQGQNHWHDFSFSLHVAMSDNNSSDTE